jgi:transposase
VHDLAASYRALVKKHFPQARIVADRFHVIRMVNHHFLSCWREIDPVASKNVACSPWYVVIGTT